MYAVLVAVTRYDHTDYDKRDWFVTGWRKVGMAKNMADAKARFGGAPVLSAEPAWVSTGPK